MQTLAGAGKKVAQGVRGARQQAQFILPGAFHALAETALAELVDMADQLADGDDQIAIDQPQAEYGDDQSCGQHHDCAAENGARGAGVDLLGLAQAVLAQLLDQCSHLLTGGAVDAFDGFIACPGIGTGGHEGVAALAVIAAERLMFAAQAFDLRLQGRVGSGDLGQLPENVLHLALLRFELAPVALQIGAVLAAQQDVLPFLHLDLEFDIGRVDQA